MRPGFAGLVGIAVMFVAPVARADEPNFTRQSDVIYARKFGTALTMDVFTPKAKPNGAGIVMVVSGGYFSSHDAIAPAFYQPLLDRGYTIFAVVHGSQPRFTLPEITADLNRAVRFIRYHAADYQVDPNRLGACGASAGGPGNPSASDPVDRESSKVQAVGCFFPPTDWLNFGAPGKEMVRTTDHARAFRPTFDYKQVDPATNLWVSITDLEKLRQIARDHSPATHVTPDDAPSLLIHGDADTLVPIQQSQTLVEKFKGAGVDAKLVVRPGAGHGWPTIIGDMKLIADWFDDHLKSPAK
jgi:acetyl esterase/lipase